MSELADLAADLTSNLPANVRRVIDAAVNNGWTLNKPGMTVALRLNHPDDDLAMPVYISWVVSRTPKGALSFRFDSCCTRGLHPLNGADLLEYLADPTVVYDVPETDTEAAEDAPPWDTTASAETNLIAQLGTVQVEIEKPTPKPLRVSAPPLRVQAPKA